MVNIDLASNTTFYTGYETNQETQLPIINDGKSQDRAFRLGFSALNLVMLLCRVKWANLVWHLDATYKLT
jgi:hypothetical protein